jgi:DNA-directed RNA polymerase beta' subunit
MKKTKMEYKRKLKNDEIETLLSFIPLNKGIPDEVAVSIRNRNRQVLIKDLKEIEIYPSGIPKLKEYITKMYLKTLVQAGESVGVMTAQSIGERQTQQTLNSVEYHTEVLILKDNIVMVYKIGSLINKLMDNNEDVIILEDNQEYLDIQKQDYLIPTTDEKGKTSWKKIEAITRHPGECIQVQTESGRSVIASLGKSFLTLEKGVLIPKEGKDLKIGDRIPTTVCFPFYQNLDFDLILTSKINEIEKYLKYKLNVNDIYINQKIYTEENKEYLSLLLNKLGILTFWNDNEIELNPCIDSKNIFGDIYLDKVVDIKPFQKQNYLYDFTVESTRNFNLFNGLVQRDTFHTTGLSIKTVVTGVPRFTELLNVTKEPKARSSTVYFEDSNDSISNLRNLVGNNFTEFKVKHLYKTFKIEEKKKREGWYDIFDIIYNKTYSHCKFCIILNINTEKLYEYKLPLYKIAEQIEKSYSDLICVFSPNFMSEFHIYVDETDFEVPEYMKIDEAEETFLKDMVIPRLNNIKICGIENIKDIFFEKKGIEWVVETEGSNLQELLCHPRVDKMRTISNDMWEIYNVFGIEAARHFLIEEFKSVVSSDGTFVNSSHILLLVDVMTFTGTLNSISRYGLKKENCGPMAKASFEESLENFLKAGLYGEKETSNGVSASVMLGKIPKMGTGLCDLVIDIQKIIGNPEILKDKVEEEYEEY